MHYFFELTISKLSPGTSAILTHSPLICTGVYDYSTAFNFFAKKLIENQIDYNDETEFLFDYYRIFYKPKCKSITSLKDLKNNLKGYLQLNIQKHSMRKKLCRVIYDDKEYYIHSGVFISTYAESLLKNNKIIKGFIVDTTWKVMPMYGTSILMGSAKNTGFPLSIAFGDGENKSLYLLYILAFKNKLGINIEDYVIESDQGSAINAICEDFKITHLCCLRHLLVSLKCNQFSYSVGVLLNCRSQKDYDEAKKNFYKRIKND